jgi:DNA-binding GntR family transcriptional regulator
VNTASTNTRRRSGPAAPRRGIDKAVSDLGRHFTTGTYGPGEVLPSIAELSKQFRLSVYTVREALKELEARGVITIINGTGSILNEARPKHTLPRDADDPTRHLHPTGPAHDLWQPASIVTAELFDIHDRAPLHIRHQLYQHRTTGLPVSAARTIPADVIADLDPAPDPYGERATLIEAFTEHYGPLKTTERVRVIPHPLDELRTELELDPEAPALEHRRLTRTASNRLLMIESETTDATAGEWEYPLYL